jgi:hypothetical protein
MAVSRGKRGSGANDETALSGGVPPRAGDSLGAARRHAQRELAKDLGISDVTLRHWTKEEKAPQGSGQEG